MLWQNHKRIQTASSRAIQRFMPAILGNRRDEHIETEQMPASYRGIQFVSQWQRGVGTNEKIAHTPLSIPIVSPTKFPSTDFYFYLSTSYTIISSPTQTKIAQDFLFSHICIVKSRERKKIDSKVEYKTNQNNRIHHNPAKADKQFFESIEI